MRESRRAREREATYESKRDNERERQGEMQCDRDL